LVSSNAALILSLKPFRVLVRMALNLNTIATVAIKAGLNMKTAFVQLEPIIVVPTGWIVEYRATASNTRSGRCSVFTEDNGLRVVEAVPSQAADEVELMLAVSTGHVVARFPKLD
jgi:hypothetical protein